MTGKSLKAKIGVNDYPQRGDIFWVKLDPTIGSEIAKTRPAVILSNNIANELSRRVIIAPITSKMTKIFPFEAPIELHGKKGKVLLDQLRTIDKMRLGKRISNCDIDTLNYIEEALLVVFGIN